MPKALTEHFYYLTMKKIFDKATTRALFYHRYPTPGKIEIVPTKPFYTPEDLSLAYSPGVAYPCLEIAENSDAAYRYTDKGNTVAVVSNGTAVLGLGNLGALASKPVMEGKALLFKIFAGVNAIDIEIDETEPQRIVDIVKAISCGFGGINLEDIKAPECFEIEERLIESCDIPVMHDDQHGTAVIAGAALINALHIQGKKISDIRMVVNGAGAAAIACTNLMIGLGVKRENIVMCDSKGAITTQRQNLTPQKAFFATERSDINTLTDAVRGADVFLGLSVADVLTPKMLASMAPKPIVFALANPNPEIDREAAFATRSDIIYATGRSDYPNQINNVLGFPYIFRAALDCRAKVIDKDMKMAAAHAIASIAREKVTDSVQQLYPDEHLEFGPDYILPKPFDRRLLTAVPPAVVRAAIQNGVARRTIKDIARYGRSLERYIENSDHAIRAFIASGKAI